MQNKSHDINAKQIPKNKIPGDGLQSQLSVLTTSNKQFFKFIHTPRAKPVPEAQTWPRRGQGVDKEYKSGGRSDACRWRKLQLPHEINIYHFHLIWNDSRVETNKNKAGSRGQNSYCSHVRGIRACIFQRPRQHWGQQEGRRCYLDQRWGQTKCPKGQARARPELQSEART